MTWRILYAYRDSDGAYHEKDMMLEKEDVEEVIREAKEALAKEAEANMWRAWLIWDVGLIADADEEVC